MEKKNNNNLVDKKVILITKICIVVAAIIVFGISILYFIESNFLEGPSFFSKHFAIPIVLFVIGILALLLPKVNNTRYLANSQGDKMMPVVGGLLILCAFMSMLISFLVG